MKKRIGTLLYFTFFFLWLFSGSAQAYIDPATTSYIIQIVAAVFITLGVVVSAFTTRVKMKLTGFRMKLLEEQLRRKAKVEALGKENAVGTVPYLLHEDRPLGSRILLACIVCFALALSFFVFGSLELLMGNKGLFPSGIFREVGPSFLLYGLLGAAALSLLTAAFRGRFYTALISLWVGLLLAGYLQGNFLNLDLGRLTGDAIDWENYTFHGLFNGALWFLIILIPFGIAYFSKHLWKVFCQWLPLVLVAIQAASLVAGMASTGVLGERLPLSYLAEKGMLDMSPKENTIVIVLDRLGESNLNAVTEREPEFFSFLDGFTRYTNNLSYYLETYPSVVNMFTGKPHGYDIPREEYVTAAYKESRFISDIRSQNYTTKFYMAQHYTYTDIQQLRGLADNIVDGKLMMDHAGLMKKMYRLVMYKYSPHVLKAGFFITTDDFTQLMKAQEPARDGEGASLSGGENIVFFNENALGNGKVLVTNDQEYDEELRKQFIWPDFTPMQYGVQTNSQPYISNDKRFYQLLEGYGLTAQEKKNNFVYYHLQGVHDPYFWNEFGEVVSAAETSLPEHTMGAFVKVREFLDQLKQLGLYDGANIIITGDHGLRRQGRLEVPLLTGLFVKRKGETGPLQYNNAPVNVDNFRASVMQMVGKDTQAYGPAYWEVPQDDPVVRRFYNLPILPQGSEAIFETFEVYGDARDFANWKKVDEQPVKEKE